MVFVVDGGLWGRLVGEMERERPKSRPFSLGSLFAHRLAAVLLCVKPIQRNRSHHLGKRAPLEIGQTFQLAPVAGLEADHDPRVLELSLRHLNTPQISLRNAARVLQAQQRTMCHFVESEIYLVVVEIIRACRLAAIARRPILANQMRALTFKSRDG